ncbi:MAG: hypothetical protein GX781_04270 [Clostridiales bacterium]|nr:hypothetical protein [Clostridiales bacterium]
MLEKKERNSTELRKSFRELEGRLRNHRDNFSSETLDECSQAEDKTGTQQSYDSGSPQHASTQSDMEE